MSEVEEELRRFIHQTFRAQVALTPVEDDTPLFSGGIIDSFGVLELISFLEDTFEIEIDTTQYDISAFDTVRKIAALVAKLRREPSEA